MKGKINILLFFSRIRNTVVYREEKDRKIRLGRNLNGRLMR